MRCFKIKIIFYKLKFYKERNKYSQSLGMSKGQGSQDRIFIILSNNINIKNITFVSKGNLHL